MMRTFTAKQLELPQDVDAVSRADLIFYGVDHSGPSYEARVFLDNERAGPDTPLDAEHGYAGSFTVFGHAGCFGDEGHCHPQSRFTDEFDRRAPHPLTPFTRTLTVTEAVRGLTRRRVRVSVVPIPTDAPGISAPDIAPLERVRLVTYEG